MSESEILSYEDQEQGEKTIAEPAPLVVAAAAEEPKVTDAVAPEKKGYSGVHCAGFKDLLLKPELIRAISDCGFEHPSEVQHMCIPQAILGTDILCQAKSGMGKTAVFVLSILHQLQAEKKKVQVVVIAHVRELAQQIMSEFQRFGKYLPDVKCAMFIGGIPEAENKRLLATDPPNIVVGTPGRLKTLVMTGDLKLDNVSHFVVDECDIVMQNLRMRADVQEVFKHTPRRDVLARQNKIKQVMMFSATLPTPIRSTCAMFMNHPVEVFVDDESKLTLHGLQQHYLQLHENQKTRKLTELLDALQFNQVIVFVNSVPRAQELDRILRQSTFPSICIHRDLEQPVRLARYREFKDLKYRILVATDLFGRGIDVERVNIVINYDMPRHPVPAGADAETVKRLQRESTDTYLHRVNRAGRFGTKGLAITFISSQEDSDVLNEVQARFVVAITPLPEQISTDSYMNA